MSQSKIACKAKTVDSKIVSTFLFSVRQVSSEHVFKSVIRPVFPLNAKKVRICEIMSGRFAVKIQQVRKKSPAVFGNFFILLKFLQFC